MGSTMSELCGVSELLLKRMRKPLFPDKIQGEAWGRWKKVFWLEAGENS